jgi:hypothetical protein
VSKPRRLRSLVPDGELFARRAAGETLRVLARDYEVHHSTLVRYFRRPDAKLGLCEARRRLKEERKARQATVRCLTQDVRRRAREDEERDRKLAAWPPPGRPRRPGLLGWLDEHDAPRGLSSRDRFSMSDDLAETVVAAGGGLQQVVDATRLSVENALRNIDPQTIRRALANDAKFPSNARLDVRRLRRLVPDAELIRRGAAKETLRSIALDYGVSHTTILRYLKRPEVSKQVRRTHQRCDRPRSSSKPGETVVR